MYIGRGHHSSNIRWRSSVTNRLRDRWYLYQSVPFWGCWLFDAALFGGYTYTVYLGRWENVFSPINKTKAFRQPFRWSIEVTPMTFWNFCWNIDRTKHVTDNDVDNKTHPMHCYWIRPAADHDHKDFKQFISKMRWLLWMILWLRVSCNDTKNGLPMQYIACTIFCTCVFWLFELLGILMFWNSLYYLTW